MVAELQRDPRGADRPEVELALGADVEQLHPERGGSGETGEQDRRRRDERVGQRAVAREAGVDDVVERRPRIVARRREDDRHDPERDRERTQRNRDRQPPRLLEPALEPHASARPPAIRIADLLDGRRARVHLADDPPLVHDDEPVGQSERLVEVFADEQHRHSAGRRLPEIGVHGLDGAHVEPSCRLRSDQHLRVALELPAEHELLEVAAREVPRRCVRPGRLDVVPLHQRARVLPDPPEGEKRAARGGRRAIRLQDGVPRDADRGREAGPEPVLRDVRDAGGDRLARIAALAAFARRRDRPG